jgi:hypothetical protein
VRRVLDIAGVAVELLADDAARARILAAAVHGFEPTGADPLVSLRLEAVAQALPAVAPADEQHGRRLWRRPHGALIVAGAGVGVLIDGRRAVGWVASPEDGAQFEPLASMALCWLLARHDRYLVHAAAVGDGADAVLALGHSGAGKSTLSLAALDAGLETLTDDVAVIEPEPDVLLVQGVHQALCAPRELGGALLEGAPPLHDLRARARLDTEVLSTGRRRIVGTAIVGHSDLPDGELTPMPGHAAMPLLLQSFAALDDPGARAAYLAVAARLARLPVWRLGHGTDAGTRRLTSARHLEHCLRACRELSVAGR